MFCLILALTSYLFCEEVPEEEEIPVGEDLSVIVQKARAQHRQSNAEGPMKIQLERKFYTAPEIKFENEQVVIQGA
ncbi:uncharacterized protein MONOS_1430 [Monocercomonoides exilis]|uniref:uncharacterized protein n=1 Tax=Monocercomonoides exilis TaxID=2049356 RepID=UPI00355A63D4|nr:hypothetical protein MONOS_1430 [Monocercomonoides exilis]|eukprot:MONOS_1430.1-p1 / transcript=MONOS_1430.1 / gene=MONOS_1430 / organism=Monocercomonoides_exilis_PA203 / gene_product=unspecified product / transcript_product=unspecified product / location=Mono_scaffold00025:124583-124810(+) / protein_length=76 / sequence_SO=supercontig / SO=protein_coding / is_pseudo=false